MSLVAEYEPLTDARAWTRTLSRYREPSTPRSIFELGVTLGPFMLVWAVMLVALDFGLFWLYGLLLLPAAGLLMRLFMIEHDCGHGAFFRKRWGNDWTGRILSVITLTPYDYWSRCHAVHHATSGNLDHRGIGDVDTLTVREYRARSPWGRARYRLYRNPAVMFGIGPFYLFMLRNRLPFGFMRKGWMPWASTMATNAAVGVISVLLMWAVGIGPFLLSYFPVVLLSATVGVWLFYVQHQFQNTFWAGSETWSVHEASLHGSSFYDLPLVLRWFTANIGIHHVHHLVSRIPFYRLPEVLRDHPALRTMGRITLWQSLKCVRLALWDEDAGQLISFREAKRLTLAG